jgi:hypothetical protein
MDEWLTRDERNIYFHMDQFVLCRISSASLSQFVLLFDGSHFTLLETTFSPHVWPTARILMPDRRWFEANVLMINIEKAIILWSS